MNRTAWRSPSCAVAHEIPAQNIAHVRIPHKPRKLSLAEFNELKKDIDRQLGPDIRATLMVWTAPYALSLIHI